MFEILVAFEAVLCLLLAVTAHALADPGAAPELELGQRAWVAARFGIAEANALGPLFKHLAQATRYGLQQAHQIQEQIRGEDLQRWSPVALSLLTLWPRRSQPSPALADLSHLVEQLEEMSRAVARYRAGTGRLMEVQVPLACVNTQLRAARAAARARSASRSAQ